MGKQKDGLPKLDDNPCSELGKASLKCKFPFHVYKQCVCDHACSLHRACEQKDGGMRCYTSSDVHKGIPASLLKHRCVHGRFGS